MDLQARARVAKSADAKDLKSFFRQRECGFKSHPGHHSSRNRILFEEDYGEKQMRITKRSEVLPGIVRSS